MESFDLLTAPSLYLIDVRIRESKIEAGLVWAGESLPEYVDLFNGDQLICAVRIPDNLRQLQIPSLFFFPSEPVEFLRQ